MNIVVDEQIELRRQARQADLDSGKSAAERNRLGQFATPNGLAVEIARYVENIVGSGTSKFAFADPSIGSGSFFSAALSVLGRHRLTSAVGVELDPAFANLARSLWSDAGLQIVVGDFTQVVATDLCPPAPDLMLANPPYVRHHHLSKSDKERLQALTYRLTGIEVSGLAGLYVHFMLLATSWLRDDGIAAWLVPSEFMDVNYGAALKGFLTSQVTLVRVHRFDPEDVQFDDALVSSVVLVFRKRPSPQHHSVEFTYGGSLLAPREAELISIDRLQTSHKWSVFPDHAKNDRRIVADDLGPRLSEFFRVQRGIATGCNKFFVLDRAQAKALELPEKFLRPILPNPRYLTATQIDADSDGYPSIEKQLCVIDCNLPEAVVQARYPRLWKYLQSAQELGILDGHLVGKRTPWYKQEQRDVAPFLCTYMGRGAPGQQPFRFIWNRSKAIGTNLYLMLHPRDDLACMLTRHPERARLVHELLANVTGQELRGEGRVYGGGLNKIEPRELARISAASFVELWPELGRTNLTQGQLFA